MIRRSLSALLAFAQMKISRCLYRGSVAGFAVLLLLQATAPAAEKIAFDSTRDGFNAVFLMNADGSEPVRLTSSGDLGFDPSLSADATRIAFVSARDGNAEIYIMDADGSNQTRLTNDAALDNEPALSPDGSRIVWRRSADIWVMNADGTGQTRLTAAAGGNFNPSFSPDGQRIVFVSNRDGNQEIYLMNADGTNPVRLTSKAENDFMPAFSPDGQRIAFAGVTANNADIWVMEANGANPTRLIDTAGDDRHPTFSRDGTKIAFQTSRGGNPDIYVMNADGSNQSPLAVNPASDSSPDWNGTSAPGRSQLLNISTRLRVGSGENVLIGGVIVTGSEPKRVILRAIGPSLSNIDGVLADPVLDLYQGNTLLASNDDWKQTQQAEIEASTIPPRHDLESAIVRALDPGFYTAVVRGKENSTGIGVVEVYDLSPAAQSTLANISSRGFVESGDNVMIGGFIVGGGARVVVRAVGPSLSDQGIPGALQDPTLQLVDANGAAVRANDNWKSDQQAELEALQIAPRNGLESAVVETLGPGNYTAIVRGNGGATGVGLVEVYNIP